MSTDPTFDEVSPEVAALLSAARATTPVAPNAALISSMAAAVEPGISPMQTTTPRRKKLIGKLITAKALGIVGAMALTGGMAAAATGTLPDPVQDTASDVADVVGVNIPKGEHGARVSDVARDKDGDVEGENHGSRVRETARDNHGHNKDTTSTTVAGDDDATDNSGPGKSTTRGNAGENSNGGKHGGRDSNDDDDSTTSTTVDEPDDSDDRPSKSGKGNKGQSDDGADDHGGGHGSDD